MGCRKSISRSIRGPGRGGKSNRQGRFNGLQDTRSLERAGHSLRLGRDGHRPAGALPGPAAPTSRRTTKFGWGWQSLLPSPMVEASENKHGDRETCPNRHRGLHTEGGEDDGYEQVDSEEPSTTGLPIHACYACAPFVLGLGSWQQPYRASCCSIHSPAPSGRARP